MVVGVNQGTCQVCNSCANFNQDARQGPWHVTRDSKSHAKIYASEIAPWGGIRPMASSTFLDRPDWWLMRRPIISMHTQMRMCMHTVGYMCIPDRFHSAPLWVQWMDGWMARWLAGVASIMRDRMIRIIYIGQGFDWWGLEIAWPRAFIFSRERKRERYLARSNSPGMHRTSARFCDDLWSGRHFDMNS